MSSLCHSFELMLGVWQHGSDCFLGFSVRGLELVWVKLAVSKQHRLSIVLVEMGEGAEALCEVEPEDHQAKCAHKLLLERKLLKLGGLLEALLREQVVLILVELLLYVSSKHFILIIQS